MRQRLSNDMDNQPLRKYDTLITGNLYNLVQKQIDELSLSLSSLSPAMADPMTSALPDVIATSRASCIIPKNFISPR